ncbi:Ig-like domain-containing protein [Longimicrobium sp.]|jgi:hypothetical protein|uniref:Ig-like domain-containing protein n=1 Tax=Longimicrobium sp. TaxID=2029185 RepID=UPI002ED89F66
MTAITGSTFWNLCPALRAGAALCALATAVACGDSPTAKADSTLSLTPAVDTLDAVGDELTLSAQVTGSTQTPTWQSTTPSIVSVNSAGKVTAVAPGQGTVRATVGGVSATANVVVRPAAAVTVVSGTVAAADIARDRVTLRLQNTGGRGTFFIEFWGLRTSPSGAHHHFADSQPVEVQPGLDVTASFLVPVRSAPDVDWVIVYTREPGSLNYRQTACYRFNGGACPVP